MHRIAKLGAQSLERLGTCHPDLIKVVLKAESLAPYDFSVAEGLRSAERQADLYAQGRTRSGAIVTHLDGVTKRSKHQARSFKTGEPVADDHPDAVSFAVDLWPYPVSWRDGDIWRFDVLAGVVLTAARMLEVDLRWGGDWDSDWSRADQRFLDAPHFELVR